MENKNYKINTMSSYNGIPVKEGSNKPFFFPDQNSMTSSLSGYSNGNISIKGEKLDYKTGMTANFILKKKDDEGLGNSSWEVKTENDINNQEAAQAQNNEKTSLRDVLDSAKDLLKRTWETAKSVDETAKKIKKGFTATTNVAKKAFFGVAVIGAMMEMYDASVIAYEHREQLMEFNTAPYAQEMKDRYSLSYERFKEKNIYDICADDGTTGLCLVAGGAAGGIAMKGYGLLVVGAGVATACYNSDEKCDLSQVILGIEESTGYQLTKPEEKVFGGIEPIDDKDNGGIHMEHGTRQRSTDENLPEKEKNNKERSKNTGKSMSPDI